MVRMALTGRLYYRIYIDDWVSGTDGKTRKLRGVNFSHCNLNYSHTPISHTILGGLKAAIVRIDISASAKSQT